MDENEFRSIYHAINQLRCPFEKTLLSRRHSCSCLVKYNIAEREAIGCNNESDQNRCQNLLAILHKKAAFAVKSTNTSLGHAKEIKIQSGGITGLQQLLVNSDHGTISNDPVDIKILVDELIKYFGNFEAIPYSEVIQSIASFVGRKRRRKK